MRIVGFWNCENVKLWNYENESGKPPHLSIPQSLNFPIS